MPLWRFRTVAVAEASAAALGERFYAYLAQGDFVGADMARKFIQMGWTRARRYANHADGNVLPQEPNAMTGEKARAAAVFKAAFDRVRVDEQYLALKKLHQQRHRSWVDAQGLAKR